MDLGWLILLIYIANIVVKGDIALKMWNSTLGTVLMLFGDDKTRQITDVDHNKPFPTNKKSTTLKTYPILFVNSLLNDGTIIEHS